MLQLKIVQFIQGLHTFKQKFKQNVVNFIQYEIEICFIDKTNV